jgi:hypothetical protein
LEVTYLALGCLSLFGEIKKDGVVPTVFEPVGGRQDIGVFLVDILLEYGRKSSEFGLYFGF